jgi:hypothetical protein
MSQHVTFLARALPPPMAGAFGINAACDRHMKIGFKSYVIFSDITFLQVIDK